MYNEWRNLQKHATRKNLKLFTLHQEYKLKKKNTIQFVIFVFLLFVAMLKRDSMHQMPVLHHAKTYDFCVIFMIIKQ
jgi:hypothetical protein